MLSSEDKQIQQEIEKLESLRASGAFESLLKYYYLSVDTDDREISPVLKTHVYNVLKDNIHTIEGILRTAERSVKRYAIRFLEEEKSRDSLLILSKSLLLEGDDYVLSLIKEALCKSRKLGEIEDYLINTFVDISGRKVEFFAEVVSSIPDPEDYFDLIKFFKDIFLKIKKRCPLGHEKCAENIISENSFFVGHYFSKEKIDDLRPHINKAVTDIVKGCTPYYADDDLGEDLLCKICQKIQSTRFGIFDISVEHDKSSSNPNVMLEIGMALAFGKKTIITMKRGPEPPADLRGKVIILYDSYTSLEDNLTKLLPKELGIS